MEPRDLGEMGESTLRLWTSQVGIAANKSDPDKTGWDFLLELPSLFDHPDGIVLPLDRIPQPLQCFVQVKSSDGRPRCWRVKLTNWLRLVSSPLPAFFLTLEFDGEDTCQRAYLVHIGEEYIRRVLKRLRDLSPDGESNLHRRTLRFEYGEDEKLSSPDGKGMLQAIRSHVDGLEAYADWKLRVLRTAGYDNGKWQIRVLVPPPASGAPAEEHLIDFLLGLITRIEATRIEVRDMRFGIVSSEPEKIFPQGTILQLARNQPVGTGMIVLSTSHGARQLRLDTEIFVPQGAAFDVPERLFKARFAAPFVDFIVWPFQDARSEFRYEVPDLREQHALKRLQPLSEFILLLDWARAHNEIIEFEVRVDSRPFIAGRIAVRETFSSQLVDLARGIAQTWTVAKHFDIQESVELALLELRGQEQRVTLIASIVSPARPPARIVYWSSDPVASDDRSICVPYVTDAIIGQYRVVVSAAFFGNSQPTGKSRHEKDGEFREFQIETDDLRLFRHYLCSREEALRLAFRDLAQAVVEEYEGSHHILIAEGINDHLLGSQP